MDKDILAVIGLIILLIFVIAVYPWIVMLLWNWLLPDLFGFKEINYWQSFGILVLCQILFAQGFFHKN